MGIATGDDKTTSFDIKTEDFTSTGFFPWTSGNGQSVMGGFIAENRLKDLAGLFKINILQKLIPGLNKSGYTEEQSSTTTNPSTSRQYDPVCSRLTCRQEPLPRIRPRPETGEQYDPLRDYDPLRIPPRRRYDPEPMPDFEDPYELNQPPRPFPRAGNDPLSIGHDDLNPPGLSSPFNPMGGGIGPTGLPRPGSQTGQGGMFMDIRGRGRGSRPPGVPPGARWDPIGPGRGFPGGGPNPFGGFRDDDYI